MSLSAPQPATVGLVHVLVLLGSPRGTHLRNGFGESGFETTLGVTNRVALLPSRQPVDFGFQRPASDSQHTVVKADCGGTHPGKNLDSRRSTLLARRSRAVAGTAGDAGRELRRRSGTLRRGDREFMLPVRVVPGAAPGTHNLVVSASYQSCNNKLCLPPKTMKAEAPVTIGE